MRRVFKVRAAVPKLGARPGDYIVEGDGVLSVTRRFDGAPPLSQRLLSNGAVIQVYVDGDGGPATVEEVASAPNRTELQQRVQRRWFDRTADVLQGIHHATYRVDRAIPELGALEGDRLYAEPAEPDTPLTLIRSFAPVYLPLVNDSRLTLTSSSKGVGDA